MNRHFDDAAARLVEWNETVALLCSLGCLPGAAREAAAVLLADRWSVDEVRV